MEREGYRTLAATDGERGLNLAEKRRPSMILLDLMLPGMDGLDVCRRLRGRDDTSRIPVVMITAKGEEADVVLGLELGVDALPQPPLPPPSPGRALPAAGNARPGAKRRRGSASAFAPLRRPTVSRVGA